MLSLGFLALVVIYAQKIFHSLINEHFADDIVDEEFLKENGYVMATLKYILNEPWCIWVLINFCYCGLLIFSKLIQEIIFGKLRVVENQHIKDQFWNFVFLKFIFIFGVLNLENLSDVIKWCTWFSIIGFLSIHSQICKDRFEYLSFSASTPFISHLKVLVLLSFIQIACGFLMIVPFMVVKTVGYSVGLFLFAESVGLFLRTLYVITRYGFHLCDVYNLVQWTNKTTISYYVDFSFEISVVTLDFLHYLHMLVYGNFYLSMASLVICMELKRLFIELKRRLRRHSNYLRVIEKMEKKFPWATEEELIDSDKCAVCWENLDKARRLPCSHIFHQNCLRSWLEQDTSCPTCRKSLQDDKDNQQQHQQAASSFANPTNQDTDETRQQQPPQLNQAERTIQRNLFHFDGSRYISWLPSFSLQVMNGPGALPSLLRPRQLTPERLNQMTEQVSQLFAHVPVEQIQQDLRLTHSVEITIENILEDRLAPQQQTRNSPNRRESNDSDNDDDSETDINLNELRENLGLDENSIFSNLLNNITNSTSNLLTNNQNTTAISTTESENSDNTSTSNEISTSPLFNPNDDSAIIAKYPVTPGASEKATSLVQRKRELILNTKKRYLEKNMTNEEINVASSN